MNLLNLEMWAKGLLAAAISGGANGVITGITAVGIDPAHFNLESGRKPTLAIAGVSALMSSIIGTAAYLKQSPLPDLSTDELADAERRRESGREDGRDHDHDHDQDRGASRDPGHDHDGPLPQPPWGADRR